MSSTARKSVKMPDFKRLSQHHTISKQISAQSPYSKESTLKQSNSQSALANQAEPIEPTLKLFEIKEPTHK